MNLQIAVVDFYQALQKCGTLKCNTCGTTYDEFVENGKFGCSDCYDVFSEGLDKVLKNIHGSSTHVGRRGKISKLSADEKNEIKEDIKNANMKNSTKSKQVENSSTQNSSSNKYNKNNSNSESDSNNNNNANNSNEERVKQLNKQLKQAIKEERYEDAAKIRDEIKNL